MAFEITIPRLGWSMEEGTFVRWLKKDGDVVNPGEAVFELEGEKAAQDIEAVDGGILRIPASAPQPGTVVAVGAVIGYLVADGEATPSGGNATASITKAASSASGGSTVAVSAPVQTRVEVKTPPKTVSTVAPAAAPSVRRMARERGIDLSQLAGSGPAGRIMPGDVIPANVRGELPAAIVSSVASPRARRVAKELGIDWQTIAGTGRDGRVRERDVRSAPAGGKRPAQPVAPAARLSNGSAIPISRHRRTVADRMVYSRQNTVPVTLTTVVDATNLVSLRQQFKSADSQSPVPSFTDIVIKLVAMALAQHPMLMAQWGEGHLVVPSSIDIGLAVDTDAGLLVPVIRDIPSLSLVEVSDRTRSLISLTRAGQLKAADMQGGAATVTNLGSFGIDAFTPIINAPEAAILGLGRIRREPVVYENQIVPRDQMSLSLTFDHRIIDGAPAARFLQTVSQAIETPSAWLLRNS